MKTSEILQRGADALSEKGWCQGALSNTEGNMCAMGALEFVVDKLHPYEVGQTHAQYFATMDDRNTIYRECVTAIANVLGVEAGPDITTNPVPDWNDHPERTAEEVILTMKNAAQYAEERERI